jgi:hypothetical protein
VAGAISQPRQSCQFLFCLMKNPLLYRSAWPESSREASERFLMETLGGTSSAAGAANVRRGACTAAAPASPAATCSSCRARKTFQWRMGVNVRAPPGARAIVRTGGGGGWGDPLERAPQLVADDAAAELISRKAARDLYGVVLRADLSLDEAGTRRLRSRRTAKPTRRDGRRKAHVAPRKRSREIDF